MTLQLWPRHVPRSHIPPASLGTPQHGGIGHGVSSGGPRVGIRPVLSRECGQGVLRGRADVPAVTWTGVLLFPGVPWSSQVLWGGWAVFYLSMGAVLMSLLSPGQVCWRSGP